MPKAGLHLPSFTDSNLQQIALRANIRVWTEWMLDWAPRH